MELIKLRDKTNNAVIEVKKTLASDYIGTGKFEIYVERKEEKKFVPKQKNKPVEEEKND